MAAFSFLCRTFFLLSLLLPLSTAFNYVGYYCGNPYNDTQTSENIKKTLDSFAADTKIADFGGGGKSSWGYAPDAIYGLQQCREDVIGTENCTTCLLDAIKELPVVCSGDQADARIWYDFCFLRYDNVDFLGKPDSSYAVLLVNVDTAADPKTFDAAAERLVRKAAAAAASQGNLELFGHLEEPYDNGGSNETIYALAQCTRDLTSSSCSKCLDVGVRAVKSLCDSRVGCQINYSSCTVRYEIYPFIFPIDGNYGGAAGDYSKYITKIVKQG